MKLYPKALATSVGYSFAFAALCSLAILPQTAIAEEAPNDTPSDASANQSSGKRVYNAPVASEKSETVYVFANADGSEVKSTEVASTLKNPLGESQLADSSNLKEINDGDGSNTFSGSGDDIVWDTNGSDVEYVGTSEKKAPVSVKMTYKLDGKEVKFEELAGATGKLTIHCDYENSATVKTQIRGEEETLYVPFTFITTMLFDNESFKNIKVTNGKLIEDGDRAIVAGYAIPGLSKSLGSIAKELDIPDFFEVNADVKDFSMKSSMTIATAGLMENVKSEDFDLSKFGDDWKELTEAFDKVLDGTDELNEGLEKLAKAAKSARIATGQIADGADELANANADLYENLATVKDSTADMPGGVQALAQGSSALADGLPGAAKSAEQLESGAGDIGKDAGTLGKGAGKLGKDLSDLKGGMDTAATDGSTLQQSADELSDGIEVLTSGENQDSEDETERTYGLKDAKLQAEDAASKLQELDKILGESGDVSSAQESINEIAGLLADGDEGVASSAANATQSLIQLKDALDDEDLQEKLGDSYNTVVELTDAAIDELSAVNANTKGYPEELKQISESLNSFAEASSTLTEATDDVNALNDKLKTSVERAEELNEKAQAVKEGVQKQNETIDATVKGIDDAQSNAAELQEGAGNLEQGAEKIKTDASKLKGSKDDGTGLYGAADGASQISSNLDELSQQLPGIASGIDAAVDGASSTSEQSDNLAQRLYDFDDAMTVFENGSASMSKSASTLSEGLKTFSEESMKGISDRIDEDLVPFADRLEAIKAAAKHYNNFSGITEGTEGSVKFIIETEAI